MLHLKSEVEIDRYIGLPIYTEIFFIICHIHNYTHNYIIENAHTMLN